MPLILILFLLITTTNSQCPDVLPSLTQKIINGHPTTPSFQLSLASPPTPLIRRCTGARISQSWAVTAAHCNITTSWSVQLQGTNITNGKPATITNVFNHPAYKRPTDRRFDITVFKLSTNIPLQQQHLLLLNNNPHLPLPKSFVRVSGYGAITTSTPAPHGTLAHVDIPVVDFTSCTKLYRGTAELGKLDHTRQLCAGYLEGGCDACSGDSGGPIIQFDSRGNAVLVALVSASRGCALPDFPGIGVRVDAFLEWFTQLDVDFRTGEGVQISREGVVMTPMPSDSPSPSPSASVVMVVTPMPNAVDTDQDMPMASVTPKPKRNRRPKRDDSGDDDKTVGPELPSPVPTPPRDEGLDDDDDDDPADDDGKTEEDQVVKPSNETDSQQGETLAGDVSPGGEISGGGVSTGVIVGGVIGGLVVIAVIVLGAVFLFRGRRRDLVVSEHDMSR